jgi:broad specificity phosphatase PhoE
MSPHAPSSPGGGTGRHAVSSVSGRTPAQATTTTVTQREQSMASVPPGDVILVRHGEPAGIRQRMLLGHLDLPLDPAAMPGLERLAVRLAARIADGRAPRPQALWTSDLQRARQTAAVLAPVLGLALWPTPALREIDFGAWDGRHPDEFHGAEAQDLERFWSDPVHETPPGGENLAKVAARVAAWWRGAVAAGPIVAVGHYGSLGALSALALDLPLSAALRIVLQRGCAGCVQAGALRFWGLDGRDD